MRTTPHQELIGILKQRFEQHPQRHPSLSWQEVEHRLTKHPEKLVALQAMEESGGEPDVVVLDSTQTQYVFCDCAAESPTGRRSVCYDRAALESRKEHQPTHSAVEMAAAMGISLLNETQYRALQELGEFDKKTSSWIQTPNAIRQLGGALFADRRYDHVFVYHNGAQSYYAARGFRGVLHL